MLTVLGWRVLWLGSRLTTKCNEPSITPVILGELLLCGYEKICRFGTIQWAIRLLRSGRNAARCDPLFDCQGHWDKEPSCCLWPPCPSATRQILISVDVESAYRQTQRVRSGLWWERRLLVNIEITYGSGSSCVKVCVWIAPTRF